MTSNDVQNILMTTDSSNWIFNDEKGSYTYRDDLCLRIQRREYDFSQTFNEPWATNHSDSQAHRVEYDVFYNNSFVKNVSLVSVDGGRATIPMPVNVNSANIFLEDYRFAKIVSPERLDEYIKRSGLIIPEN